MILWRKKVREIAKGVYKIIQKAKKEEQERVIEIIELKEPPKSMFLINDNEVYFQGTKFIKWLVEQIKKDT